MEAELKKRKINPPPRRVNFPSTTAKEAYSKAHDGSMVAGNPPSIHQVRNYAVSHTSSTGGLHG